METGIGVPPAKTHAFVASPITEAGGMTVTVMGAASFHETGS